jgi:hypothetical protein
MKQFAKRLLVVAGTMTLAVVLGLMAVPRAAHAVTSLLVQITNTVANPVPNRDVDNPVRQAVQLRTTAAFTGTDIASGNFTTFDGNDFVVPAGKRLVVEFISGDMNVPQGVSATDTVFSGVVSTPNGNYTTSVELGPPVFDGARGASERFGWQPLRFLARSACLLRQWIRCTSLHRS